MRAWALQRGIASSSRRRRRRVAASSSCRRLSTRRGPRSTSARRRAVVLLLPHLYPHRYPHRCRHPRPSARVLVVVPSCCSSPRLYPHPPALSTSARRRAVVFLPRCRELESRTVQRCT